MTSPSLFYTCDREPARCIYTPNSLQYIIPFFSSSFKLLQSDQLKRLKIKMKIAVAIVAIFAVSCQAMINSFGQGTSNQGGMNPLMTQMLMQKLRGGNSNQAGQGGQGGSPFPAAMMPLILGSDRGTKMLATTMAMKNPAMLQAIMLNGGMSDNMARSLAMMGMFQSENGAANGQGQNQQILPLMYAMSGNQELSSMFPFFMNGAGNAMNTGNGKAAAGTGGQAGGAPNMMDAMLLSGIF